MKNEETILQIAVPTPLRYTLDYLPPPECDIGQLKPGMRIAIPFRNGKAVGILVGLSQHTTVDREKLRHAFSILDKDNAQHTETHTH